MTEAIDAEYICVGSPTLNKSILPSVAAFLAYLKGLAPRGRKAIAFGSYGWSNQSVKFIASELEQIGLEVVDSHAVSYIPDTEQLQAIRDSVFTKIK